MTEVNTRQEILNAASKCVNGQRQEDYGKPESNFQVIADMWNAYLGAHVMRHKGELSIEPKDVAAMMALLKIARIGGGGEKMDSWVDLAGYAACGGECEAYTMQTRVKEAGRA